MTTVAAVDALPSGPRGAHVISALDQADAAVDQLDRNGVTGEAMRLLLAAIAEFHHAGCRTPPRLVSLFKTVLVAVWVDARSGDQLRADEQYH
jgi:hypothetical protein